MGFHMSTRTQKLTVYLLKSTVTQFDDAFVEDADVTAIPLKANLNIDGAIYYKASPSHSPSWASFIQDIAAPDLTTILRSQHSSVIALFRASKRIFAFVFGYGRALLSPAAYERDFGIKVVLNAVDPDKIRCIDTHSLEEIPVLTRQQASRLSALELFDLDRDSELVRAIVGTPRSGLLKGTLSLGKSIAGAEALAMSIKTEATSLVALCEGLLTLYTLQDYQKHGFDWIDNLKHITDPQLCYTLNSLLLDTLLKRDSDRVTLAPPEVLDWDDVEGFRYSTDPNTRREPFADIAISDFYDTHRDLAAMSLDELLGVRVTVRMSTAGIDAKRYNLFDCVVFDTDHAGTRYVLSNGLWFSLDKSFAAEVTDFVKSLPESAVTLPKADPKEYEEDYSLRAHKADPALAHMDQRTVKPPGVRTAIEVCDLFSADRQFIHIKPYKGSSTLSHLFSQGTVSADLFQNDVGFRKAARDRVHETRKALASKIPLTHDPDTHEFEIVYAVIAKTGWSAPWQQHLPFFAQLNLRQAAMMLKSRGYKVAVKMIPRG